MENQDSGKLYAPQIFSPGMAVFCNNVKLNITKPPEYFFFSFYHN